MPMKLITKHMRDTIPALLTQQNTEDPVVHAKFFDPTGSWTWYVIEMGAINADGRPVQTHGGDEADIRFFGLVDGFVAELGTFSLNELRSVRGQFGLGIERDLHWKPVPLSEVYKQIERGF